MIIAAGLAVLTILLGVHSTHHGLLLAVARAGRGAAAAPAQVAVTAVLARAGGGWRARLQEQRVLRGEPAVLAGDAAQPHGGGQGVAGSSTLQRSTVSN